MNEKILQLITEYGLEATVIALAINILTGLLKLPIKSWAAKLTDGTKLTRYLVFLPVLIGLVLTVLYVWIAKGGVAIDRTFVTMWISASSLSMTFYAFWEKLFPTKERILKEYEIEENKKLLEKIKTMAEEKFGTETNEEIVAETEKEEAMVASTSEMSEARAGQKIVLRGNTNAKTEAEEKSA